VFLKRGWRGERLHGPYVRSCYLMCSIVGYGELSRGFEDQYGAAYLSEMRHSSVRAGSSNGTVQYSALARFQAGPN
jgi:hypothetical protein